MIPGRYSVNFSLVVLTAILFLPIFSFAQKKTKIKFEADNIEYDETLGKKARRLIDNVVFEHKGVFMYCDSAYQYPESNSLDAFGRVKIVQGDSMTLYTDSLNYNGDTEIFKCKNNVVLDNKDIHLETDYLIFNRGENFGYYLGGGEITNRSDQSLLVSEKGYYYTELDEFYFKKDVVYTHPEFIIKADTLKYNSEIKKTTFLGPTDIEADSNFIYCERGFFNSNTGKSEYHKNAYMTSESRIIKGDSIFYDTKENFGRILGNADILDTSEQISIRGEIALLYREKDSAVVTDMAELQQYLDEDTMFLHADTFKIFTTKDSSRVLKAYRKIRFFKSDLQGQCDSMVYAFSDSAIMMYYDPILWSGENQITGEYVQLNMAGGRIHSMDINQDAFINSLVDSIRYNQIRGKDMTGYFKDNQIDLIDVVGNGQTIYYPKDDDDKFIGVNRGESSNLKIKLKNNEINRISYINDANSTFFPLYELSPNELRLRGFQWLIHKRPTKREDIFNWVD
jgi:lipopolysaccharide export system protein LptA